MRTETTIKRGFTRLAALICAIACILATLCTVFAEGEDQSSIAIPDIEEVPYVYLYNFENDMVLHEKGDMTLPLYPTSTVKIMTGITAIEALGGDMTKSITVTADMLNQASGNKVGFQVGEIVNAEQMLYATLVNGANDAAIILAHIVADSVADFVTMMNEKALEIGARSTSYANPTGMHDDSMYTTMADTIAIAKYAYNNPYLMEVVGTQMYVMEETNLSDFRKIYNRNCLLSKYYRGDYYYEYAIGMNAGSTTQGGYSSISIARNAEGTLTYLCVIMNAKPIEAETAGEPDTLTNYQCAIDLFNWAFRAYEYKDVLSTRTVVCEVPVRLSSTADYITLVPSTPVTVYLPSDVDLKSEIRITSTTDEVVNAPITKGQEMGSAKVMYGDVEIGRVTLIATSDVDRSEFLWALDRISEFTRSRFFIATVVSLVVLSVIYVLVQARIRQKRLRSRVPRQFRR